MVADGVLSSFLYLMDIVKDSMQLVWIIYAVHGISNAFENWSSFSSVVSAETKKTSFDVLCTYLCFF